MLLAAPAVLLLAGGGAIAATDPFSLFRSSNPGTAIFRVDETRHVKTPTAQRIQCPRTNAQTIRCGTQLLGQRYTLTGTIQATGSERLTRKATLNAVRQASASKQISSQTAQRIDADLSAISDSDLASLGKLLNYGTLTSDISDSKPLAPPPGVPALLVCESQGSALGCRDLNGDDHAAVGSGIYQALPAAGWVPVPPHQPDPTWRLEVAILGHAPTAAARRFLRDLLSIATSTPTTSTQTSSATH